MIQQLEITLPAYGRGYHLIDSQIAGHLSNLPKIGILHLFLKHTSAALSINENADPSVRDDFESIMNRIVPENQSFYTHILEGSDDMPAHVKTSLIGPELTIPITNHQLNMGIWQGIYLCEFRNRGGGRKLVVTIYS
ncbi:secondary thiamine-phosphate synthase enzyme YjbQ [Labilibaculum sp. K2S]|uniref:secondary thiamine-phosphate synthase enzyme YjbQ n=1 Tax=Labilibaculum sp. K2S TaxID=3056386 RepID=UPI0025A4C473|nr:secondary thiamine-phosphate synthase enzyme YjbQ [Labilibaculum sp. K2S]MDM8161797.1 secondary thiamine-phosphate synthase enzyme YjbQ [Labilibaculum sp. K2S]